VSRIQSLPKSRAGVYRDRARDFAGQMDRASEDGAWNSVGLLAVHCVISACDALTVGGTGQRWSGQDHAGVQGVVRSMGIPDAAPMLRLISDVLSMKNRVEYESRPFSAKEAQLVRKSAERILAWVEGGLPRP
jgi:uncharacterized membrane protein